MDVQGMPCSWDEMAAKLGLGQPRKPNLSPKKRRRKVVDVPTSHAVFTYGRSSNPGLDRGNSKNRQDNNNDSIALKERLGPITRRFYDRGEKGWDDQRQELTMLKSEIEDNPGCALIVEDIDRFLRVIELIFDIGPFLIEHHVRLFCKDGLVTPKDFLRLGLRSAEAYDLLCHRSLAASCASKHDGVWTGAAPFGYDKPRTGVIVPNAKAQHVLKMFQMRAEGKKFTQIARHLEDANVLNPSGGIGWGPSTVSAILEAERNCGYVVYNMENGDQPVTYVESMRIVEDELFAKVQAVKAEQKVSLARKWITSRPYLLSAAWYCSVCGSTMRNQGKRKGDRVFRCSGRQGGCKAKDGFLYGPAEAAMLVALKQALHGDDFEATFLKELKESHEQKARADAQRKARLDKSISILEEKIDRATSDAFDGVLRQRMQSKVVEAIEQLEALTVERNRIRSVDFAPFASSTLPSLSQALDGIIARTPFVASNPAEEGFRDTINDLVSVKVEYIDDTTVRQTIAFDFGDLLALDEEECVVTKVVEYAADPQNVPVSMQRSAKTHADRGTYSVSDSEFQILMDDPIIAQELGAIDPIELRKMMDALGLVASTNMPIGTCLCAYGIEKWHPDRERLTRFRKDVGGKRIAEIFRQLRPHCKGYSRLSKPVRPARYVLSKFEVLQHPILGHELCRSGAPDRVVSEDEWQAVILAAHAWNPLAKPSAQVRQDLDILFFSLRNNANWASAKGYNAGMNASRRFWKMVETGLFDHICHALLVHSGLRSQDDAAPFPLIPRGNISLPAYRRERPQS